MARKAIFTVSLDAPAPGPITIQYTTVADTATAGEDFTAQSGTLSFAEGEQTKTIEIVVRTNDQASAERFTVVLSNPIGCDLLDEEGVCILPAAALGGDETYVPVFLDEFTGAFGKNIFSDARLPDIGPSWSDPSQLAGEPDPENPSWIYGPRGAWEDAAGALESMLLTGTGEVGVNEDDDGWDISTPTIMPSVPSYFRFRFKVNKIHPVGDQYDNWHLSWDLSHVTSALDGSVDVNAWNAFSINCHLGMDSRPWDNPEGEPSFYAGYSGETQPYWYDPVPETIQPVVGRSYTCTMVFMLDRIRMLLKDETTQVEIILAEDWVAGSFFETDYTEKVKLWVSLLNNAYSAGETRGGDPRENMVLIESIDYGSIENPAELPPRV